MLFPKPKTPRDGKFLRWIDTLPCCAPGCGVEQGGDHHHTECGGTGLTGSDYKAVPMCREHHSLLHTKCSKAGMWKSEVLEKIISGNLSEYKRIVAEDAKALDRVLSQLGEC